MPQELERHVRSALGPLRLCWASMVAATLACAGLGVLVAPVAAPPGAAALPPLPAAITALGVLCAAATIWLERRTLAPRRLAELLAYPDSALARRHLFAGHLALWSLAELPALLGLAQLLLDGTLAGHLALCAISLGILALSLPTRARIAVRLAAALR